MYAIDLKGKTAVILGVANQRSIAASIAGMLQQAGASLAITYQNDRIRENVEKIVEPWTNAFMVECDVSSDENVEAAFESVSTHFGKIDIIVHSIAFANRDDLGGRFINTAREGFRLALDISAYSLIPVARFGAPFMTEGGSIMTLTFQASERVFPGYNVMGTAKAALENEVIQLAHDLGSDGIRVNAISPGPLDTVSSRVISGYRDMKRAHQTRSPMGRNVTHEEAAGTALFLSSDLSTGITGQIITVDTGYGIMGI